ncbi:hypothetical protein C122C_0529 [Leuconostoc gelidum subsp. gasicomitatum]|uniref:Uncharacterized protein n=1 Tax=Leuconostoc gasicomitatum TaxID=115778 RepID=A0ABM9V185_9LACO|nr:hypothetical protein LEGAS_1649 [Leuconostoc gasicomitatum LMG 18811]CUW07916.1 hypothetical protein C122C_0529 [Leuconostoc gasicomitatum]CUW14700.1 hypothetical protein C120C_1134 [Leuconostoc inhae]
MSADTEVTPATARAPAATADLIIVDDFIVGMFSLKVNGFLVSF